MWGRTTRALTVPPTETSRSLNTTCHTPLICVHSYNNKSKRPRSYSTEQRLNRTKKCRDNTEKTDEQTYFHCGPYDFDGEQKPFITVLCEMINKILWIGHSIPHVWCRNIPL